MRSVRMEPCWQNPQSSLLGRCVKQKTPTTASSCARSSHMRLQAASIFQLSITTSYCSIVSRCESARFHTLQYPQSRIEQCLLSGNSSFVEPPPIFKLQSPDQQALQQAECPRNHPPSDFRNTNIGKQLYLRAGDRSNYFFPRFITISFQTVTKLTEMPSLSPKMMTSEDMQTVLEAYSMFGSSQAYQQKSNSFKKKIQSGEFFAIRTVIGVIKNLLVFRDILNCRDVALVEGFPDSNLQIGSLLEAYEHLTFNEFSKLLALRFLRETYFDSSYLFMNQAHLQLTQLIAKIGMFRKQSSDEERGRYLFQAESRFFQSIRNQSETARKIDKQLETIGFSIHKIALQMLFVSEQLTHFLPFHEQYVTEGARAPTAAFFNSFFTTYTRLKQQKVKFPTKFHYFREKDAAKFSSSYLKINCQEQIHLFFKGVFEETWMIILSLVSHEDYQQGNLYIYLLTFTEASSSHLKERLEFCSRLVLQTCDRFFWRHFNQFLEDKVGELKNWMSLDESLTEKELKAILTLHIFLLFFNYHILEPEIMYLIEHKYIHELANIFLVLLKSYGKLSQIKESSGYRPGKSAKSLPLEGSLTCSQTLKSVLFCLKKIKQFSIEFTHQFHQKLNNNHSYPFISWYADIILQIEPASQRVSEPNEYRTKVEKQIIERMNNNHEFYFKKQEFLFTYYEKNSSEDRNLKQIKGSFKDSVQKLLNKYSKYIKLIEVSHVTPLTEYINIERESIEQEQIEIIPKQNAEKTFKTRFSYRLNLTGSQKRFHSEFKDSLEMNSQKLPAIMSAVSSPLSFVESLKVDVARPQEGLVKSLSSSRKLKKVNQKSNSHLKSYSSNELSQFSQSVQSEIQKNAQPLFSTPPQFKQVFIEKCEAPIFEKSMEHISTPIKSSLKRVQKINRNNNMVSTKYINNFIEEHKNQTLAEPKMDPSEKSSVRCSIRDSHTELQSKAADVFEDNVQTRTLIKQVQIESKKLSYANSVREFEREELPSSKAFVQPEPKQQSETTMCFYFTPKAKKQLLKKKVLVKKHGCLEIGMIANLQEDILTNETSTYKRYAISIKIYVSALVPIQKVNVNIKFPNWLDCISKANLSRQNLKEQAQYISNFIVEMRSSREKIIQRNYGDLPVLSVVYVDRLDRKQVISEPLYVLPNRFSIEKAFNEEEFLELIHRNFKFSLPFLVHERISIDIKGLKQYYSSLMTFHLEASQKILLFSELDVVANDNIAIVKLQFVRNHEEMLLLFFQGKLHEPQTSSTRPQLFLQLSPLRPEEWGYEELHIFETCLRSIFHTDK